MTPRHFDSLSHAISSAGSPIFFDALLAAFQVLAPVERLRARIFRLGEGLQVIGLVGPKGRGFSSGGEAEIAALGELFEEAAGRHVIVHSLSENMRMYPASMVGVGYAWRHGASLYLLEVVRPLKLGQFEAGELQRLSDAARLVASIVGVHATRNRINVAVSSSRRDDVAEKVVRFLGAGLTRREAEVVSRIVMGMRTEMIGAELGIKPATVITFRKRAYAKLGVGRQAELFARCVQVFSDLQAPKPTALH